MLVLPKRTWICPKIGRNRTIGKRWRRFSETLPPFGKIESPFHENKTPKEFSQSAFGCGRIGVSVAAGVACEQIVRLFVLIYRIYSYLCKEIHNTD